MGEDRGSAMRKLGRWAGRVRSGFLAGLRGERQNPAAGEADPSESADPGKRVIVRRTTIEELEIHDPERR
ncbi:MAG: hypothetical protein K8E66_00270 [Phycisphaerales bacterium]|nr:hypothetical protein [Phycisphaerales bacterium]